MQQLNLTRRRVITLCGSTKFREHFTRCNAQLTMAGYIVLSVGFFMHAEAHAISDAQKHNLDMLHFDKIEMGDGIYVVNVAGYVGASTAREIAFALARGKTVEWLEPAAGHLLMTGPVGARIAVMASVFAQGQVPSL